MGFVIVYIFRRSYRPITIFSSIRNRSNSLFAIYLCVFRSFCLSFFTLATSIKIRTIRVSVWHLLIVIDQIYLHWAVRAYKRFVCPSDNRSECFEFSLSLHGKCLWWTMAIVLAAFLVHIDERTFSQRKTNLWPFWWPQPPSTKEE